MCEYYLNLPEIPHPDCNLLNYSHTCDHQKQDKKLLALQAKYPNTKIILTGMQIPPNMGKEYTEEFKAIYPAVAKEKNIELIPFLLEGVAGNPDLNLPDGIHPTPEGHRIVMETLWPFISKAL